MIQYAEAIIMPAVGLLLDPTSVRSILVEGSQAASSTIIQSDSKQHLMQINENEPIIKPSKTASNELRLLNKSSRSHLRVENIMMAAVHACRFMHLELTPSL